MLRSTWVGWAWNIQHERRTIITKSYRRFGPLGMRNGRTIPIKPQKTVKTMREMPNFCIVESESRCSYSLDFAMEKRTCSERCDLGVLVRRAQNQGIQKSHISREEENLESSSNTRIASAKQRIYHGNSRMSEATKKCFSTLLRS